MQTLRKAWLTEHLKMRLSERTDLSEQAIRDLLDAHCYALLRWDSQRQRRYCLIYDAKADKLFVLVQELHTWAVLTILPLEFWQRRAFRWLVTPDKVEEAILSAVHGQSMNPLINPQATSFIPRLKPEDAVRITQVVAEKEANRKSEASRLANSRQVQMLRNELGDDEAVEKALAPLDVNIRVPSSCLKTAAVSGTRTTFLFDVALAYPTGYPGKNFFLVSQKAGLPTYVRIAQVPDHLEFWARIHELLVQKNLDPARVNRAYVGVAGYYHPVDVGPQFDEVFGTNLSEVRIMSSVPTPARLPHLGDFVAALPLNDQPMPGVPAGSRVVLAMQYTTPNGYVRTHESLPVLLEADLARAEDMVSSEAFVTALTQVANVTQVPVESIKAMYARIDGLYFPLDFAPALDRLLETSLTVNVQRPSSFAPVMRLPRTGIPEGLEDLLREAS